ncbi:alpha/beta fold hydrolase [Rubrobacter marinus]|uniref:Alpha/beta fold hydrolase n=1 Tax=Rubrobacter marinus TaxID=2653852 RepID=A0A6G8PYD3_9ACTN|nr:alpha/beta hydrolase [Rubrobacter marinus]QIN79213.1 alpha/beta fold hydrolase [Rubrobacter marinus]
MSAVIIVVVLLVGVLVAASVALGRRTDEVDSARDTEYLELEGSWIRYRVSGGGPPVLLVHGWLSSGRVWERLANRLAQRFTVYSLDLSGFGESDKPISGYGVRYGSRLLYAFCAHFGLTRAAVVGHDLGGAMAVKLAADHPDVVGRLVLVATPADEDQMDLPTFLWLATLPVVGPLFYTLGRYLRPLRGLWMRPFVSDSGDLTEEAIDDAGMATPASVTKTLNVARRELSRGRLVRQAGIIKVPVLVIVGEEDQIVDPQAASDWARALPTVEVVLVENAGHLPMLERTGEFNAQVLAFFTGDSRYLEAMVEEPPYEDEEGLPDDAEPAAEAPGTSPEDPTTPNVVRKQHGRYDSPQGTSPEEEPGAEEGAGDEADGAQREDPSSNGNEDRPRVIRRRPAEPAEGRREEPLSEVPEDLFQWPEAWKEFRPRERSRRQDHEEPEGPEDAPNGR